MYCLQETHFRYKDKVVEHTRMEKKLYGNINQLEWLYYYQTKLTLSQSYKRQRNYILTKGSFQQEDTAILNI